jgi:hypothetical protein
MKIGQYVIQPEQKKTLKQGHEINKENYPNIILFKTWKIRNKRRQSLITRGHFFYSYMFGNLPEGGFYKSF